MLVDGIGTSRRIQSLIAYGWPEGDLAGRLSLTAAEVAALTSAPTVPAETAHTVAELFAWMQMHPGPSAHAREYAAQQFWPLPLEWDEDVIDDPLGAPVFDTTGRSRRHTGWWRMQPCIAPDCVRKRAGYRIMLCASHYRRQRDAGTVQRVDVANCVRQRDNGLDEFEFLVQGGVNPEKAARRLGVSFNAITKRYERAHRTPIVGRCGHRYSGPHGCTQCTADASTRKAA